jgi:NADP-dependent 3-hydroxy acid dehydrogenase YdfG
VAVVTGASSGIGAATVRRLAGAGFDVVGGARRLGRVREVCDPVGARALPLDVTDADAVAAFAEAVGPCDVLVNNAGGALDLQTVAEADPERWRTMYDTNVLGVVRVTQALLPAIEAGGDGHVVVIGSIAGTEAYAGGGGYNAAKFGVRALTQVLRAELLGRPVRVSEIDPGLVETEFSLVRFDGDADRAAEVYAGMTPLSPDDVADAVAWVVTRPAHVNVDSMALMARDQLGTRAVHRRPAG